MSYDRVVFVKPWHRVLRVLVILILTLWTAFSARGANYAVTGLGGQLWVGGGTKMQACAHLGLLVWKPDAEANAYHQARYWSILNGDTCGLFRDEERTEWWQDFPIQTCVNDWCAPLPDKYPPSLMTGEVYDGWKAPWQTGTTDTQPDPMVALTPQAMAKFFAFGVGSVLSLFVLGWLTSVGISLIRRL
jgi:hypothetical protein